jgi:hypothetical protein
MCGRIEPDRWLWRVAFASKFLHAHSAGRQALDLKNLGFVGGHHIDTLGQKLADRSCSYL